MRNARPTRWATSRWCKAFPVSKRKSSSCAKSSSVCYPRKCRCFRGGRWPIVLTRTATTLTVLAIIIVGTLLHHQRSGNDRGNGHFHELRRPHHRPARAQRQLHQRGGVGSAALARILSRYGTPFPLFAIGGTQSILAGLRGLVEFKHVSFSYDGKRMAVADLNFKAMPGETIALVGATGAGKSTAIALLHRAFDPQSGQIEIDGTRHPQIQTFRVATQYRRGVPRGAAVQSFNRRKSAGRESLMRRKRRCAMRSSARKPLSSSSSKFKGFEDNVGERGRSLSGGERQRLSIARALLKNPPILILDEATSALDADTETKVMRALDEVMKGRTTFVIAHRLSTVRKASRILVFDARKDCRGRDVRRTHKDWWSICSPRSTAIYFG